MMGTNIKLTANRIPISNKFPAALSGGMRKKYRAAVKIEVSVPEAIGKYPIKQTETNKFLKNFSMINKVRRFRSSQYQHQVKQVYFQDVHNRDQDDTHGIFWFHPLRQELRSQAQQQRVYQEP